MIFSPAGGVRYTYHHPARYIDLRSGRNIDLVAKYYWTFDISSYADAQRDAVNRPANSESSAAVRGSVLNRRLGPQLSG